MFEIGGLYAFWFDTYVDHVLEDKIVTKEIMSHEYWTLLEINKINSFIHLTILYDNQKYICYIRAVGSGEHFSVNNGTIYKVLC